MPFLAVVVAAQLVPTGVEVTDLRAAGVFALVLALLNALVRPIISLLALPITCLTLGLFHFVINAIMFWLAAQFVPGVRVDGFVAALIGSLIVSVVGAVTNLVVR